MLLPKGAETLAIVGNGPITDKDRANIEAADSVLRFNEVNSWCLLRPGPQPLLDHAGCFKITWTSLASLRLPFPHLHTSLQVHLNTQLDSSAMRRLQSWRNQSASVAEFQVWCSWLRIRH